MVNASFEVTDSVLCSGSSTDSWGGLKVDKSQNEKSMLVGIFDWISAVCKAKPKKTAKQIYVALLPWETKRC